MNDPLMTTTEVAQRLGLSRPTITRYCRTGRIKAVAINTGPRVIWRIHYSAFMDYVPREVRGEL